MRNIALSAVFFATFSIFAGQTLEAQLLSGRPFQNRIAQPRRLGNRVAAKPSIVGTPAGTLYPYVIARPEDREWIRQTPVEMRPNRPLHFWGNSRRRVLR